MTPFENYLIATLKELNEIFSDDVQSKKVDSFLLADCMRMKPRTIRYWLRKLEEARRVWRPYGERSGWVAV